MADEAEVTLQNADAAAEALAKSHTPADGIDPQRESALDSAFAELSKTQPPAETDPSSPDYGRENGGVRQPLEGEPSAEEQAAAKKAEEEAAAAEAAKAAETAAKPEPESETTEPAPKKGLLDDLTAEPKPPAAKDPYAEVKLRSDASPKTRESFEQLKTLAKQREEAAIKEASDARAKLDELTAKVAELEKKTVPDEVQNELKELRAFRAQFDTANDPEFRQKFDTRINGNYDAVYAKLASHGLPETEVAKLKAFSQGDRDAAIENLISKLPPLERKFIEAKLLDNINVSDERERALQEARTKADEILAQRKQAPAQQTAQRDAEVAGILRPVLPKLGWLHVKDVPANASPEMKKQIEASNEFALEMQEALKTAIVDDSPKVRAEAAIAVPLAQYYRREYASEKARADALQKQLDGIKQASATSRTARSSASATPPAAPARPAPADSGDALDQLFQEATSAKR